MCGAAARARWTSKIGERESCNRHLALGVVTVDAARVLGAALEFRPSYAEHEVVAAALTAVTHPVGAAPDQRQAQTAGRRLGQRFCRGVLRRAGRVERDAGVHDFDARLAGCGRFANFDADANRLGPPPRLPLRWSSPWRPSV